MSHQTGGDEIPGLTACSLCAGETLGLADGQMARLERLAADGTARLTLVECLDECNRGDVVVARPSAGQRVRGAEPVWFQRLAGDSLTAELAGWLRAGGPGACPLPAALRELVIDRRGVPAPVADVEPGHEPAADCHR